MLCMNVWLSVKQVDQVPTVRHLLAEAARLSRAEPGCLRFEVYHSQADSQKFLLVERWESQQALDGHRQGVPYTQIYQPKVMPLVAREGHPCQLVE